MTAPLDLTLDEVWPQLGQDCAMLRIALAAYGDAIEPAAGRLLEQAGTTRALGLLPAETWIGFARGAAPGDLAGAQLAVFLPAGHQPEGRQRRRADRLESAGAVGGAHAGGAVVALLGGAQVVAAAEAVGAGRHVVQVRAVGVEAAGVEGGTVAGQGDDGGDERRGRAGAADFEPARLDAERVGGLVVNGHAGVGVGHRGYVGGHPHGAVRGDLVLVGGLLHVGGAAAARAAPGVLDPAS